MAKRAVRRVAYSGKAKGQGKSITILGVDPGLANTGVVVMKMYPSGKFEVVFSKTIRTKSGSNLRERVDAIAVQLVAIALEYGCKTVICEAFEVRGWQKTSNSGGSMSKLINVISLRCLESKLLFGLSSPDMKKRTDWELLIREETVVGIQKVKSCHAKDAGLHAILYLRGDLLEKLGIN